MSAKDTPRRWAERTIAGYKNYSADRIVGEVNNGGDLLEANLRTVDMHMAYKAVRASRGKLTRAEPIAGLYEQRRVHHVGILGILEDQLCDYSPGAKYCDRMDALVWAVWELSEGVEYHAVTPGIVEFYGPGSKEALWDKAARGEPLTEAEIDAL